jgi:hypothetical protein
MPIFSFFYGILPTPLCSDEVRPRCSQKVHDEVHGISLRNTAETKHGRITLQFPTEFSPERLMDTPCLPVRDLAVRTDDQSGVWLAAETCRQTTKAQEAATTSLAVCLSPRGHLSAKFACYPNLVNRYLWGDKPKLVLAFFDMPLTCRKSHSEAISSRFADGSLIAIGY